MGKTAAAEGDAPNKKQHRKKNAKLLKKRSFKRNKKKFKVNRRALRQIKRDKDELRKLGYISKAFADKVPSDKILDISVTLQKMLKHSEAESESCESDLVDMFKSLDEGDKVDLQSLEDQYMQAKLLKLFTLLKLQHGKSTSKDDRLKFQKRTSDLHSFSFAKMISQMLKRANEKIAEKKAEDLLENKVEDDGMQSETDSDDMSICSDDGSDSENEIDVARRKRQSASQQIETLPKNMKVVKDDDQSDSEEDRDGAKGFLANTMGIIKEKDTTKGLQTTDQIANDLDALFGKHM